MAGLKLGAVGEKISKFRRLAGLSLAALTLTITGCAELPADAPTTPVDYRACVVSPKTSNYDLLAETADYSVRQAVVTYGIQRSRLNSNAANFAKDVSKQIRQGCRLFVVTGSDLSQAVLAASAAHKNVNFAYIINQRISSLEKVNQENLVVYSIDTFEAGLISGYIAGSASTNRRVLGYLCPNDGFNEFLQGVQEGVSKVPGAPVQYEMLFDSMPPAGPNQPGVIVSAACDLKDSDQIVTGTTGNLLGYGSDLYGMFTSEANQKRVLSTVEPQFGSRLLDLIASDLEGDFIGGSLGSYIATFGNAGLGLSAEHDLNLPSGTAENLKTLTTDYEASLK